MTVKDKITEIRKYMISGKQDFEAYLKSNAPLEEKWAVFLEAPIEMSNFMPVVIKELPFEIDWELFCENRHNTINMPEVMVKVAAHPEHYPIELVRKFKIYDASLKNLLMVRNIKEFRYDWLGEK